MNRPESVLCDPKMTLIFGLILIFVTSVKTECTEQNCPEVKNSFNNGSFVNGESLQSECKPGYYRLNISDYKSKCYKFDCPGESKKVNNATHPSMIPTCICDTERNYWGNDSLNCHYKDPPCPSGKLVRETGKCDCEPGFYYIDGSCIAQDSHSSSLVPDLHSTSLAPVNNTESHGNLGRQAIIAISVGGVIFVVIIVIVICCTCYIQKKRRKQQSKESKMEEGVTSPLTGNNEGSEENQSSSTPVPNLEANADVQDAATSDGTNHSTSNSSSNDLNSFIPADSIEANPEVQDEAASDGTNHSTSNSSINDLTTSGLAASIEANPEVQDEATSDGSVNNNSPQEIHVHNHFHGPVVSNCDVVQFGDNNTAKYKKVENEETLREPNSRFG